MYVLYVADDCCLCDEAVAVLARARLQDFTCIGIDDDGSLQARYGMTVPVLRDTGAGQELAWPFDVIDVQRFLGAGT